MRRSLLAFLALVPATSLIGSAPAAPAKYPAGQVVFRPECFGGAEDVVTRSPTPYRQAAPTPPPQTTPAPLDYQAQIPAGRSFSQEVVEAEATAAIDSARRAHAKNKAPAKPAKSTEAPSSALSADEGGWLGGDLNELAGGLADGVAGGGSGAAAGSAPSSAPAVSANKSARPAEPVKSEEKADAGRWDRDDRTTDLDSDLESVRRGPALEWGATTWLSNDDSMSLASAQRLLYAAMNGLPFDASQIRPHELLNYFSFDAVTPEADQVFDVLASAERDGDRLSVALAVKGATPPRQELDLTLVVDRSCSMEDEGRMDYTRRGLTLMSDQLRTGDRLDVVLFDDRVCVPLENYVVGRDDPKLLEETIRRMAPEGSTDVGLGLRKAYEVAQAHLDTRGRNRRVMLVTDALMNTGDVDPHTVSEIGRAFDADGIRLTGIGVGREFDDQVLDLLTEKGKGAYVFLGSEAVVDRVFGEAGFDQLTQTVAHDVQFALKLPRSLAMERFYGEEASTVREEVQPINYFAGTTQLFLQDLVLEDGRVVRDDPIVLEISYSDARTGEPATRTFRTTVGTMVDADPHNVRKGLALMAWTDLLSAQAMGADPCGAPLQDYARRASKVPDDAEIAFVNGLVTRQCGAFDLPALVSNDGVPFKVRVDADIPVSEVAISCAGERSREPLTGSDVIAMFTVTPGVCELTLSGTVDMTAKVEVPRTGGDLRCLVRGGRLSCS